MGPTPITPRLRRLVAALGLTSLALGCGDGGGVPFSPIDEDRVYALADGIEVFGSAYGSDTARTEFWTVADTVIIREDGTGETRTYNEERRNGVVTRFNFVQRFRHRPINGGLRADFIIESCLACLSVAPLPERFDLRDGRLYRPLGRGIYPYDRID
jgi:hypothetical protein